MTGQITASAKLSPSDLRHLVEEGLEALAQEDVEGALELGERALADDPNHPPAVHLLGLLAYRVNEPVRALRLFELAHNLAPGVNEHAEMLAIVNARLGRLHESLYFGKLAGVLEKSEVPGLLPASVGTFGDHFLTIADKPLIRAGDTALASGLFDEAVENYRKQLQLDGTAPTAWRGLARALVASGDLYEGLTAYRALGQVAPNEPQDLAEAARVLARLGRHDISRACHFRIASIASDDAAIAMARVGDMALDPEASRADVAEALRGWAGRFADPDLLPPITVAAGLDARPLRIGFVGHELRESSEVDFMLALIGKHSSDKVRIYCYSNNTYDDESTPALRNASYAWCDIARMDDDTAALVIRNDGIDLLVDLSGTAPGNRAELFAMRPAPVQLSLFGLPESAAVLGFDGVLGDAVTHPPGSEPDGSVPVYRVTPGLLPLPSAKLLPPRHREADEPIVFGALATRGRVSPFVVACWTDILSRIPGARLLLDPARLGGTTGMEEVVSQFAIFGGDGRIDFLTEATGESYDQEFLQKIDILLDAWPAASPYTVRAALSAGTPVVVLAPALPEQRTNASMLTHAGLGELVAETSQAYVERAIAAATDIAGARAKVAAALRAEPDVAAVVDGIETAYRSALQAKAQA